MSTITAGARRFLPLALLLPLATPLLPSAAAASEPAWVLSFAATGKGPVPMAGVELDYQLRDRIAVGLHVGSFVFHNDVSLRSRFYLASAPGWGLYAGVNAHLWYSPILSAGLTPVASGELGGELRFRNRVRLGLGLGMAAFAGRCQCGDGPRDWTPLPVATLRLGKAF